MILIIAVVLLLAGITLFELFDAVEDFDDRER